MLLKLSYDIIKSRQLKGLCCLHQDETSCSTSINQYKSHRRVSSPSTDPSNKIHRSMLGSLLELTATRRHRQSILIVKIKEVLPASSPHTTSSTYLPTAHVSRKEQIQSGHNFEGMLYLVFTCLSLLCISEKQRAAKMLVPMSRSTKESKH
jgi:hypothetical protein